jgi:NAD(P)-dependent dehydrogenase (short-subunit alcohol dehydrogenase family)
MHFENKVVFVTGAAGGIGGAAAQAFLNAGASVFGIDRASSPTQSSPAGGRSHLATADISNPDDLAAAVAAAIAEFGRIDYAINCAGVEQTPTLICDTDTAEMSRVIDINLKGCWLSMQAELPFIRQSRGAIVNIASFWGEVGIAGGSSYAAAKGGIIALTRAIAAEEANNGVRVNCISPGAIQTPMLDRVTADANLDIAAWARERTLAGFVAEAHDVASLALFLCKAESRYFVGQNFLLDGGYTVI